MKSVPTTLPTAPTSRRSRWPTDAPMPGSPAWRHCGTGELVFKVHADIVPSKGSVVPVLIWEISERDERHLDAYEGYPSYYTKRVLDVTMTDFKGKNPKEIQAMVYVMTDSHNKLIPPMKGYYDVLAKGYERFGFNQTMLRNALREARESAERGTAF